jgi:hypothetical protein
MSINQLHDTWFRRVRQLWGQERITLLRNMAWFLSGVYASRSVQLQRVAGKIPGLAKLTSRTRRLSRFLANPRLRVRVWYEPLARWWVQAMLATVGEVRLVVDGTQVGWGHQLLLVAIAFRRRAIPLAWTWVKHAKGHSSAGKQLALLAYVQQLIPAGARVVVVGDSEFGAVAVLRQVEAWQWQYVLRQTGKHRVQRMEQTGWQPFRSVIPRAGQSVWLPHALLTAKHAHPVNLLAYWQVGEKQPWLLATNLPSRRAALRTYRRRMWIDELFGDLKKHGFDLESTHVHHLMRLSRLTLLVALLYLWSIAVGLRTIKQGRRHLVDRTDRRDLSIFQIGVRIIERYLVNAHPIPMTLRPCLS